MLSDPKKMHKKLAMSEATPELACFALQDLLKNNRECLIAHRGEHYNLRLTKNNKLILTK